MLSNHSHVYSQLALNEISIWFANAGRSPLELTIMLFDLVTFIKVSETFRKG